MQSPMRRHGVSRGAMGSGDRFIPIRRSSDLEAAHFKISSPDFELGTPSTPKRSHSFSSSADRMKPEYRKKMACLSSGKSEDRVLAFSSPRMAEKADAIKCLRMQFESLDFSSLGKSVVREIPKSPDKVMDIPGIRNDYCCTSMDWSSKNVISVPLGECVSCWNAGKDSCEDITLPPEEKDAFVTAVAWDPQGIRLAIGLNTGDIQIYNIEKTAFTQKILSCEHETAVSCIEWSPDGKTLFRACKGCFCVFWYNLHEDTENYFLMQDRGVYGIKMSYDGRYLAGGGKDKMLKIWDMRMRRIYQEIKAHKDTIKALAWCPWQSRAIATGGGAADEHCSVWDVHTKEKIADIATSAQVCSLVWGAEFKELITSHGIGHNNIMVWKYPDLDYVGTMSGHEGRVLQLAIGPTGKHLASCGADEVLMLWSCFGRSKQKAPRRPLSPLTIGSPLSMTIR